MEPKPNPAHQAGHSQSFHFRALINKQGRFRVHGTRDWKNPFLDLYHYFFSLSWPKFFVHVASLYFFMDLIFAALYFIIGVDASGNGHVTGLERFKHCFFLSVQTLTALDYNAAQPSSTGQYVLMGVQAFLGVLTLATITGLFYARFSRPTARIIFSNKAIIGNYNGKLCLFFRIANERLNQIAEAHMTLTLTKNEISREGEHSRRLYELKLERDYSPLFSLSWTVRHFIDEHSPMFGMDDAKMREGQVGILASLTGIDETFSAPIVTRYAYAPEDIVYNRRFKDIIVFHEKKVHIDLKGIHDLHEMQLIV